MSIASRVKGAGSKMVTRVALSAVKHLEKRGGFTEIGNVSAFLQHLLDEQSAAGTGGVAVNEQTALTLSYAYACIKVLSETVAHVPLQLMKREGNSTNPATDHPLYDLMSSSPSSNYTSYNFKNALEGHRSGWGNCYAQIIRPNIASTEVEEFQILSPAVTIPKMVDIPGQVKKSLIYESMINGQTIKIPASDVIHVPGLGFDGVRGYSPVHLQRMTIGHGLAMQRFGNSFFSKGAKPSMIFKSTTTTSNVAAFQKEIDDNFMGEANWGKTMVLPKGVDWSQVTINPNDAQWLESRKFNRTEVAGIWRVPPHFIGDLENNTFTNAVEMDLSFVKHTMVPIFTSYEQELDRKLLTPAERAAGYFFKFDIRGVLRGSPETRSKYYESGIKNGWMTPAKAAQMEDLPADDELLDVYYMPINSVPAGTELQNMRPSETKNLEPIKRDLCRRITKAARGCVEKMTGDAVHDAEQLKKIKRFIVRTAGPLFDVTGESVEEFAQRFVDDLLDHMKNDVAEALPFIGEGRTEILLNEVFKHENEISGD